MSFISNQFVKDNKHLKANNESLNLKLKVKACLT